MSSVMSRNITPSTRSIGTSTICFTAISVCAPFVFQGVFTGDRKRELHLVNDDVSHGSHVIRSTVNVTPSMKIEDLITDTRKWYINVPFYDNVLFIFFFYLILSESYSNDQIS